MATDHATMLRHLQRKSKELLTKEYLPGDLVALVVAVADRQIKALPEALHGEPGDGLTPLNRHGQGLPLLPRERFQPDRKQTETLLHDILAIAETIEGPLGKAAKAFRMEHLEKMDMDRAIQAHLASDEAWFQNWEAATPDCPRLVKFLVQTALGPSLIAQGRALDAKRPNADKPWTHGHCPVCGSLPFISALHGKEGQRFCSCSFCLTEYRVPRLACPYCGENDHKKLSFYDSPDEPGYRIDACKTCRNYIKTTDFRNLDKISVPSLDDLESLHMDILAKERSFQRPTLSAWGF